jgi:predicted nucleic acid-binding protein
VNALVQYVRAGRLTITQARAHLEYATDLPIEITPCDELADEALGLAVTRGITGYDAMYLALAEATDTVLVTADRQLAAVATRAELLTD